VVIISLIVVSAGGGPNHESVGFRYWNETPFHDNGFKGFLSVMPTCIFAMAGSENCGLVAVSDGGLSKLLRDRLTSIG
jgi:yeast amino acid transporter